MPALETAAGVIGVLVPALQGAIRLKNDIQSIIDAPRVIHSLEDDLVALIGSLELLEGVTEVQWQQVEPTLSSRSETTLKRCSAACRTMGDDLARWTKRSKGDKLS